MSPARKYPASRGKLARRIKKTAREDPGGHYVLRLYVTGLRPRSMRAIANIREICEQHLKGRYTLSVIDLYQKKEAARVENILAAPTLIKKLPAPLRRLIGDMSNKEKVLAGLDLIKRG
jgi:circadian clock protein KaiB